MNRILVTGGAGFIGSNFIHYVLSSRKFEVINFDKLTYSSNLDNLKTVETHPRYHFVLGDICDVDLVDRTTKGVDAVVHFAAETHVDRSIGDSRPFVEANVVGTQTLLDAALRNQVFRFIQIGTDEVYGSLSLESKDTRFTESSPLYPNSPYSATKLAGDMLARAYWKTHSLPVIITRSSNNFGPYQFPEKVIPLFVTNLLNDKKVPLYGDGLNVRDWIYVEDNCRAILKVLEEGKIGCVYNIGSDNEISNIELTKSILNVMGRSDDMIEYVEDRLGHDRRYAIDSSRIRDELHWKPKWGWEAGLKYTIDWYINNPEWWSKLQARADG